MFSTIKRHLIGRELTLYNYVTCLKFWYAYPIYILQKDRIFLEDWRETFRWSNNVDYEEFVCDEIHKHKGNKKKKKLFQVLIKQSWHQSSAESGSYWNFLAED